MQRSRVQESIQMTMQRFLHGLRLPIKNIVRHHTYNDMNQLLHNAMEAEAQLAEEAQQKSCFSPASRYTARAPSSPAPVPLEGTPTHPSSSTRPATSGAQSRRPAMSVFWIPGYPGPPAPGPLQRPSFGPGCDHNRSFWRRPSWGGAS
jgi:hypothetical protein